ncbi:hypothetical protein RFI_11272, partial [Reticulomyxa filosa]
VSSSRDNENSKDADDAEEEEEEMNGPSNARPLTIINVLELSGYVALWLITLGIVIGYFALQSFPDNNTLNINGGKIITLEKSLSFVLVLHNSFIAPKMGTLIISLGLRYGCSHWTHDRCPDARQRELLQIRVSSIFILCLRTAMCIVIPIIVATYFYDSCGRGWVNFWELCADTKPQDVAVNYKFAFFDEINAVTYSYSPNYYLPISKRGTSTVDYQVPLMTWSDICHRGFHHQFQYSISCTREILEKWCNVIVVKMLINIFMPWLELLARKIRSHKFVQRFATYVQNSLKSCCSCCCNDASNKGSETPPEEAPKKTRWLFAPLLIPLSILTLVSNDLKFKYVLSQNKNNKLSINNPPFPVAFLLFPYILQQLIWILLVTNNTTVFSQQHDTFSRVIIYGFAVMDSLFFIFVLASRITLKDDFFFLRKIYWMSINSGLIDFCLSSELIKLLYK